MKKIRYLFGLIPLAVSMALTAQPVTLQFRQTEYDIKDLQMIDTAYGFAVGEVHWDRDVKVYKSTILRTTDGGYTWFPQQTPVKEDLWAVHFIDPDHGWVCGKNGLMLYTGDGGTSWARLDVGTNLDLKSVFFTDASTGWVAGNEVIHELFDEPDAWRGSVWKTTNGGSSWMQQNLPADAGLIQRLYFRNSMEGWALGVKNEQVEPSVETRSAAYYTGDGGEIWTERYSPDLQFVFTDIDFTDQDHGCLIGFATSSAENGGSIFMTSDGGENWQRKGEDKVLWQVDFIDSLRGYAIGADYAAAWGPPVFRTMDGGASWQNIRMEKHNSQGIYGLAVSEDQVIGLGDDGYLVRSMDPWGDYGEWNGEHLFTQILIDTLYQFEDVFFITPSKGWVVGQRSTGPQDWAQVIMHTDDGGKYWQEQYSFSSDGAWSHTLRLNAVQFVNENRGWAVGFVEDVGSSQTSGILFTDDGGTNWSQQGEGITEGQLVDLYFIDDRTGWVLTDAAYNPDGSVQLLKTTDAGDTWEMMNTGQEAYITIGFGIRSGSLCFPDENTGWVLGAWQDLLKTEDGGATWVKIPRPEQWTNTYDIDFADDLHGTICGDYGILHTSNGGETWVEHEITDRTLTALQFLDSVHGWMVGEYGLVYRTADAGSTWEQVEHDATQAALKSVSFPSPETGWAVGRAGIIAQINPLIISASGWTAKASYSFQLCQNQPNPLSDRTAIQFRIRKPGNILLAVYDLQGRRVKVLAKGFRDQGRYHVIWDRTDDGGSPVTPGAYFYRLVTDEGSESRSLIVL